MTRRGREVKRKSASVTKSGSGGRFGSRSSSPGGARYRVSAVQAATAGAGVGQVDAPSASSSCGLTPGRVRAAPRCARFSAASKALGYVTPVSGSFGGSTSRAVLAFRKVFGMSRITVANKAVFRRLAKGGGRYRVRYPKAGRHVEFDWSRQVLVLARGSRPVKVLHASSGAPVTPTVFGTFRFYRKSPGYNAKGMYYSNYFIGGYAIHGYESVPTYPASHGCIRIPIPSATSVYRLGSAGRQDLRLQVDVGRALDARGLSGSGFGLHRGARARLDVPLLPEPAHRERDQQHRDGDQQERKEPEQALVQSRAVEAGLVAVEPGECREAAEDDQEDRERARDRKHAAVPAGDVEGEQQEDDHVEDRHHLRALELLPAADGDDRGRATALSTSRNVTIAFVDFDSGFSRLGCRGAAASSATAWEV